MAVKGTFIVVFLCFAHLIVRNFGGVQQGSTLVGTASPSVQIEINIPFERCMNLYAPYVDARATAVNTSLQLQFSIFVLKIHLLSFDAMLVRLNSTLGWDYMAIKVDWKAYYNAVIHRGIPNNYTIYYSYLSENMTWSSARSFCRENGRDLCSLRQICPINKTLMRLTRPLYAGKWTPIKDPVNNWMQMAVDRHWTKTRQLVARCPTYTGTYAGVVPPWGEKFGPCPPWSNQYQQCFIKGHVFCCKSFKAPVVTDQIFHIKVPARP